MLMIYERIIPFWLAAVGGFQVRLILRDVTFAVVRFLGGPLGTTVKRRIESTCLGTMLNSIIN